MAKGYGWVELENLKPNSRWKLKHYQKDASYGLNQDDFVTSEAYDLFYSSLQNALMGFGSDDLLRPNLVERDGRLTEHAQEVLSGKAIDHFDKYEDFIAEIGQSINPGSNQVELDSAVKTAFKKRGFS